MSERGAPRSSDSVTGRLERCIRDMMALTALPSMCVGRSPAEALDIVMDALPTALSCDLVYLALPGSPARARLAGREATETELMALSSALGAAADETGALDIAGLGEAWCVEVELPLGSGRGRLVAGRARP